MNGVVTFALCPRVPMVVLSIRLAGILPAPFLILIVLFSKRARPADKMRPLPAG